VQNRLIIAGEQKGCVYVSDACEHEETHLVLQVRHCVCGPPLLPNYDSDGILQWNVADDPYMHFSTYLAITMERLTGQNWSRKILPHLHGTYLVRYQAVVKQEDWRQLWDALLKPFGEQRVSYRRIHKTSKAPDIFFGAAAKPCAPSEVPEDFRCDMDDSKSDENTSVGNSRVGNTSPENTTSGSAHSSDSGKRKENSEGIVLPRAGAWLEFWQNQKIPQHNTFIQFAERMGESGFLRRVQSSPDLAGGEESDSGDDRVFSL
jgi:hypothetical protein